MPLFATFLGGILAAIVEFFAKYITKKLAVFAAVVTILTTLTTAFIVALKALYVGVAAAAPSELTIAMSWIVPSNASACVGAYIAAVLLRWAYDWNVGLAKAKLWIT